MSDAEPNAKGLQTTGEVIDALGGTTAVARLMRIPDKLTVVSNWRSSQHFPADTFLAFQRALGERGLFAPPCLWRQREPQLPVNPAEDAA